MFSNIFGAKKKTEYSGPIKNEVINQVVTELNTQTDFKEVEVTKDLSVRFSVEGTHTVTFTIQLTLSGFAGISILHGMTTHEPHPINYRGDRKDPKDIIAYSLNEALTFAKESKSYTSFVDLEAIEELTKLQSLYVK